MSNKVVLDRDTLAWSVMNDDDGRRALIVDHNAKQSVAQARDYY